MLGPDNMSAIAIRYICVNGGVRHPLSITTYVATFARKRLICNEGINALLRLYTRLQKQKGPERIRAI